MDERDAFERILASFYDAMLDDARWPAASALIDEACGVTGSGLLVVEGTKEDVRLCPLGIYYRGEPRRDLEREYLENYHPADERVPRFRGLADGRLVHVRDLYTDQELMTSPAYNEMLPRARVQDGLNARLEVSDGCHIAWCIGNPVDSEGWTSSRIAMITRLLPHIRQFGDVPEAVEVAVKRVATPRPCSVVGQGCIKKEESHPWRSMTGGRVPAKPPARNRSRFRCRCRCWAW